MPQAPNMVDEPFKIVIAGAKHTHVRDEHIVPKYYYVSKSQRLKFGMLFILAKHVQRSTIVVL